MSYNALLRALFDQLRVTPQALSQRRNKVKKQCPMTTKQATYVIAHQEGVPLDKYLEDEEMNHVRGLLQQISGATPAQAAVSKRTAKKKAGQMKEHKIIIGKEFKETDPILSKKTLTEAKEMAAIYPFIYVLENSIREVINVLMTSLHGDNWWDTQVKKKLKETVAGRMAEERKNAWHQRRGARPIDYLDLKDLPRLMRKIEKDVVPNILPSMQWFDQLVDEVYQSRCVVCHMNPLDKTNIKAVEVRLTQWQKLINARQELILNQSLSGG